MKQILYQIRSVTSEFSSVIHKQSQFNSVYNIIHDRTRTFSSTNYHIMDWLNNLIYQNEIICFLRFNVLRRTTFNYMGNWTFFHGRNISTSLEKLFCSRMNVEHILAKVPCESVSQFGRVQNNKIKSSPSEKCDLIHALVVTFCHWCSAWMILFKWTLFYQATTQVLTLKACSHQKTPSPSPSP